MRVWVWCFERSLLLGCRAVCCSMPDGVRCEVWVSKLFSPPAQDEPPTSPRTILHLIYTMVLSTLALRLGGRRGFSGERITGSTHSGTRVRIRALQGKGSHRKLRSGIL